MEHIKIGKLTENDFDKMIEGAGGSRLVPDATRETSHNADYILNEAIIELKSVDEEGLEKENRQAKLAELFKKNQPDRPVVIIDPGLLDERSRRKYYNIMSTPIKTHVGKAAKQLNRTKERLGKELVRVLMIINNGYGALDDKEFKKITRERVLNDTSNIDAVVIGGMYYYGDGFDYYNICPFEIFPLDVSKAFKSFDKLKAQWLKFCEGFMTSIMLGQSVRVEEKTPIIDLKYIHNGITYIKLAPNMGKDSTFWPKGRPRERVNPRSLPPVSQSFPSIDKQNWGKLKEKFPNCEFLQETYDEWFKFEKFHKEVDDDPIKPLVPIIIDYYEFLESNEMQNYSDAKESICSYTYRKSSEEVQRLYSKAKCKTELGIIIPEYIYLLTEEIGQDKANDISSIYYINEEVAQGMKEEIVVNQQMCHEHALILACAHAAKLGIEFVLYDKDRTYAWT